MTRTAVRRHVDLADGQLVIRRIVVETSECRDAGPASEPAVAVAAPAEREESRRPRGLRPGRYLLRVRETHLI
jgi:hypothetical protein